MSESNLPRWLLVLFTLATGTAMGAVLEREENTTLQLPQSPPVFGYQFTNAFSGVTFVNPMAMAAPPGETNRLFVVERAGRIAVITNLAAPSRTVFLDISEKVFTFHDCGLQSMAFHPGFATNGQFFLFYTGPDTTSGSPVDSLHDILSRFTLDPPDANSAAAATEQKLIRQFDRSGDHNGADLQFGSDGYLYLSLGDEGSPGPGYDYWTNSQYIDRNFFAGVLRLDVDLQPGNLAPNAHPASVPNSYKVPADNPFVGATQFNGFSVDPTEVRTEFWAVGLRNPFRFSFDRVTGLLYLGDVGQAAFEEVNIITRGGNYGWIFREGSLPTRTITRPVPPGFTNYIDPVYEYPPGTATNQGRTVIGGIVYRGDRISQLNGHYVFGDHISSRVWAFRYDGTNVSNFRHLANLDSIVGFAADPATGDVLAANIVNGVIYRLIYDTNRVSGAPLPATLTDTGAFTDLASLAPHAGIVPYEINVPFWSDNAIKRRWFSVPDTNLVIDFRSSGNWSFPAGSVWIKHFDLELTNGLAASARRLETRFIVKNAEGVYGVTYRWNGAGTEATLVPEEGADESFVIHNLAGGIARTQVWHFPSRVECLRCHTAVGGLALGFNTPQMNRDASYGSIVTNQIRALSDAGYFSSEVTGIDAMTALAHATNSSAGLEFRVRSYLAANCVQCHQPGGVPGQQANWDARITTPLSSAGIVDGTLADDLGDPNNRVVRMGSLSQSVLFTRVGALGPHHMPPLATSLVDAGAVSLLTNWIAVPPLIQIVDWSRLPGGDFQLTLSGTSGWTNVVEAADSLNPGAWFSIGTNVFTDGLTVFVDDDTTNSSRRFYRAVAE